MIRDASTCSALAALLIGFSGCASQTDNSAKQLRTLGEQVRRLQSTSDRLEERLAALENTRVHEANRATVNVKSTGEIPPLPVVKATTDGSEPPTESRPSLAEHGDESRPLIVGEGSRIETRTVTSEPMAPTRRTKDKSPAENTGSKRSSAATESGKKSP